MLKWGWLVLANKLDKKYKDLVLGSIMILLFLSFTAFSLLYVGKIDIKILLYLGLVVEVFYAMPRVVIGFHRLYAQPLGAKTFLAFIPHLNYVICLNKVLFVLCNILAGLFVIFALLLSIPSWLSLMPNKFVYLFSDYSTSFIVVLTLVYNLFIGIGVYSISVEVNKIYARNFPSIEQKGILKLLQFIVRSIPFLELVVLIVPIARSISLFQINDKMDSLDKCGINAFTEIEEE